MRMSRRLVSIAAGAVVLPVVLAAQQPTFKAGTQVVPLYVTVVDADKRLVADLAREDFEVLDNGKPVALTLFNNEPEAFSVVVMLDTSGSMTASLALLKDAAEQFVIRLLPEDRGMVGAFSDKIQFPISAFTSDRDELAGAIKDLGFGNPTRLYDAIEAGIQQLRDVQGRRVVLVFTDGDDTASKIGMGKVLDQARADEVMIYTIGLESEYFNGQYKVRTRPDRGLKRLSDETGGGYFELKQTDDLGPTFTRVAQELHSQYVLGFPPATDGKLHKVEVRVKKLAMVGRARKSYLAPTSGTQ
ncbi:MAG: VWA domain-containing protein [Vicinamibacteria bacterium]|nr:VWA domain-containing protein [Vicinamibacteria bacterium]